MKKAIAFGIRRTYGSYQIVELTKVSNAYYYGRDRFGYNTHGKTVDLLGYFDSAEIAQDAINDIHQAVFSTEPLFRAAKQAQYEADAAREKAINEAIDKHRNKGKTKDVAQNAHVT